MPSWCYLVAARIGGTSVGVRGVAAIMITKIGIVDNSPSPDGVTGSAADDAADPIPRTG